MCLYLRGQRSTFPIRIVTLKHGVETLNKTFERHSIHELFGLKSVKESRHEDNSSTKETELDADAFESVLCEAVGAVNQLVRLTL